MTGLVRTGIGSLPHTDVEAAVAFVSATTDVPYLPQLPNRHAEEAMLLQWGDGIVGAGPAERVLAADSPIGPRNEAFVGAAAMLRQVGGGVLKTQATGPVTLTAALRGGGVSSAGLLDRVADEVIGRIVEHVGWIRRETAVERLVVILDEPALAVDGDDVRIPRSVLLALRRTIASIDAEVGIHCCGDTDWGALAALGPAWLSWDLAALGHGFAMGVDQIAEALGAGARVMWGIVPTTAGPLPDQNVLLGRYGTALANLVVAGAPFASLKAEAWFTPACGLAGLSVADAEAVTEQLELVVREVEHGW